MKFTSLELNGAYLIELEKVSDERGFFARTFCEDEFKKYGLNPNLKQISIAYNKKKNTVRGMHYMKPPNEEAKLVRCSSGSIYDVIIDLRKDSCTFKKWFGIELKSNEYKMVYLPEGCAHGYMTLEDNTEVIYQMSIIFKVESYSGVRWNDPVFNIKWPSVKDVIVSKKDSAFLDFKASL